MIHSRTQCACKQKLDKLKEELRRNGGAPASKQRDAMDVEAGSKPVVLAATPRLDSVGLGRECGIDEDLSGPAPLQCGLFVIRVHLRAHEDTIY